MLFKPILVITGFLALSCLLSACSGRPAAAGSLSADSSSVPSPFVSRVAQADPAATAIPEIPGPSSSAAVSNALSIQLKGTTYLFPGHNVATKRYNFAAVTSNGIVWSPAPPMEGEGTDPAGIPLDPFTIYLSAPADIKLNAAKARKLWTLALPEASNEYTKLSSLQGVGEYVVYHTYTMFRGGAQALKNQAWALKTSDPADNIEILSFHAAGGYFYRWGIEEQNKLYVSVSQRPDGDDSYEYEVYVYSFEQERKTQMNQFTIDNDMINFQYKGRLHSVKLQQG